MKFWEKFALWIARLDQFYFFSACHLHRRRQRHLRAQELRQQELGQGRKTEPLLRRQHRSFCRTQRAVRHLQLEEAFGQ